MINSVCVLCFSTKPLVVALPELGFFLLLFFGYDRGLNLNFKFPEAHKQWLDCKAKEATQSDFTVNVNSFVS